MALASAVTRLRRLKRLFAEVREQSGHTVALRYVSCVLLRKMPVIIKRIGHLVSYRAQRRRIRAARARDDSHTPFIGIKVTGGVGDYLVIARFIRDLANCVGQFDFDIYATRRDAARWVFDAVGGLHEVHDAILFEFTSAEYDIAACINQTVVFYDKQADWVRLDPWPGLIRAIRQAAEFRNQVEPLIRNTPYMDGQLAQRAVCANRSRADFLHYMVDVPYGGDQLAVEATEQMPARFALQPGQYVTVHNGFDPQFFTLKRIATKCYPHFGKVIAWLKPRWPDLQFVQIGVETSHPLGEADLNLVQQTSLAEAAGLIRDAVLHIDNEGGLAHLARCLGVDSCVVFGPTPSDYFGYAGNINIDPTFCGGCWWNKETWMDQCPRGFAAARCMTEQDPRLIASAVECRLSQRLGIQPRGPAGVSHGDNPVVLPAKIQPFAVTPE